MSNVLEEIVVHKRGEIEAARRLTPEDQLRDQLPNARRVRGFVKALQRSPGIGLIAEVKKASPSAGLIRKDFDPGAIAKIYEAHGATCISCLTDEHFFGGHLDHLRAIREHVSIPLLRKDFILDRYQVLESRAAGTDCVLLIAECLNDETLADLFSYTQELEMDALIEIYEPENLERVLRLNPPLVGINNRNLKTFVTELDHSIRLSKQIPDSCLLVSESGIRTHDEVLRLQDAGVAAILVGETLMRSPDIGSKVDELLGRS